MSKRKKTQTQNTEEQVSVPGEGYYHRETRSTARSVVLETQRLIRYRLVAGLAALILVYNDAIYRAETRIVPPQSLAELPASTITLCSRARSLAIQSGAIKQRRI